jgi:hypothetical protein
VIGAEPAAADDARRSFTSGTLFPSGNHTPGRRPVWLSQGRPKGAARRSSRQG